MQGTSSSGPAPQSTEHSYEVLGHKNYNHKMLVITSCSVVTYVVVCSVALNLVKVLVY
mgnify:CR=1 FL=1